MGRPGARRVVSRPRSAPWVSGVSSFRVGRTGATRLPRPCRRHGAHAFDDRGVKPRPWCSGATIATSAESVLRVLPPSNPRSRTPSTPGGRPAMVPSHPKGMVFPRPRICPRLVDQDELELGELLVEPVPVEVGDVPVLQELGPDAIEAERPVQVGSFGEGYDRRHHGLIVPKLEHRGVRRYNGGQDEPTEAKLQKPRTRAAFCKVGAARIGNRTSCPFLSG